MARTARTPELDSPFHARSNDTYARERLRRLRSLAHLLDNAIPLPGGFRVGLDPIIGFIPGLGDAIGALVSVFILMEASSLGVPKSIIGRMVGNVMIDSIVGSVPLLGDLFDFAFKANSRNIDLLERYHLDPQGTGRSSRWFLIAAAVLSFFVLIAVPALVIYLVVQIVKLF